MFSYFFSVLLEALNKVPLFQNRYRNLAYGPSGPTPMNRDCLAGIEPEICPVCFGIVCQIFGLSFPIFTI